MPPKSLIKLRLKKITEPVVAGLRSDCWGAMTDKIFLETLDFLHLWMASCDVEEKQNLPKSFY